MATTNRSAVILRHTANFLSETLSQSDLRHKLSSIFLQRIHSSDQTTRKHLNLAAETIENAISAANNTSVKTSSLRLAEKVLLSFSEIPFSSYLLSLVYALCNRPVDASLRLLDVFRIDPSLARLEVAPHLFEELFLVHLLPVLQWNNEQRSMILSSLDSEYTSDDQSVVSATRLSTMSGDQASDLKDLEGSYEEILDENCRAFAEYFMEVLRNEDGNKLVDPPPVVLGKNKMAEKFHHSEDNEEMEIGGFRFKNGRYNPLWGDSVEGGELVEVKSNRRDKNLSKFPSFYPQRVSPRAITRQRSLKKSDYESAEESCSSDNLSDSSSSDSEAEKEDKNKEMSVFQSRQTKPKKQQRQQPLLGESSRPPDPFMGDFGKNAPPKDFVCPITTQIMYDPVTLETGQTFERKAIQEWLDRGNSTCPITRQKLMNTRLPKTNYVLKRLIASWQEQHPSSGLGSENEPNFQGVMDSVFRGNVMENAVIDSTVNDLHLAITSLCTSEILKDSEMAVLQIQRFWQEDNAGKEIQALLSKPPVINGFVEILFNSVDPCVLKGTVFLLAELGSRENSVIQTLTRVDTDVECIIALFKKGLLEAVVLICLLKPFAKNYFEMGMLNSLLAVLSCREEDLIEMCMNPKSASVLLLGQFLRTTEEEEEKASETVKMVISAELVESIIGSLEAESMEERKSAGLILLRCMKADGECRNLIAEKAELTPLLESFIEANDGERFEIVQFLSELLKLNRRTFIEQLLHIIKNEGTYSTMHSLLMYLQNALQDQCPIIAGLLLHLDLLAEPRKMSIYREEAIDTLISCLRNPDFPAAQLAAAETILSLQGRFSYSGKPLLQAFLLNLAGINTSYKSHMQYHHGDSSDENPDNSEEEKAAEEWERKVAFALVSHEFGLMFEALAAGLQSRYEDIFSACFVSAAWLIHTINVLPDTGIRGAARVCLLKPFVSIFQSSKDTEDKAISLLALNSFVGDPEGMHDLTAHMKDIMRGLRELKKSSRLAVDMLKLFSEEQESSAELWNHKEIVQEDCNANGEVLSIVCSGLKVFSSHSDGTIKAWTLKGGLLHLIQETREHAKAVTSLAILHSTEKLYSGSLDRTVRVWSVTNGGIQCEQVHETKDHVNNLVVSNTISCFIPQGAGVKVHSWSGGSKLLNQQKHAKCLALVNEKVYCGCYDNSIQEIDLATGAVHSIQSGLRKLLGKSSPIHALQVSEGLIYSAGSSMDGAAVKIWDASTYRMVGSLVSTLEVRAIAVSSDLIYLGCKGGVVEVWCKKKHTRVETLQTGTNGKVLCMGLDSTEEVLVIGTSDGKILAWGLS
ncbi:PREDICTED: putative E3 ubiquitin-protein ligase LIN-1 [Ipomoea nil]|uniref:putative E3 ubiquitin-protein ligase LIN-1 n=1 Tax=Ipomoea nil TaxID=35883 RepID=UPI000900E726|nr:PREDICTED: putative E3 ubiquitin-protein ligase LIN-1 [Ipomoea nil]